MSSGRQTTSRGSRNESRGRRGGRTGGRATVGQFVFTSSTAIGPVQWDRRSSTQPARPTAERRSSAASAASSGSPRGAVAGLAGGDEPAQRRAVVVAARVRNRLRARSSSRIIELELELCACPSRRECVLRTPDEHAFRPAAGAIGQEAPRPALACSLRPARCGRSARTPSRPPYDCRDGSEDGEAGDEARNHALRFYSCCSAFHGRRPSGYGSNWRRATVVGCASMRAGWSLQQR